MPSIIFSCVSSGLLFVVAVEIPFVTEVWIVLPVVTVV